MHVNWSAKGVVIDHKGDVLMMSHEEAGQLSAAIAAAREAASNIVVVTRHLALVQYLREEGLIAEGTLVLDHARAEDVAGKDVIGVLPMHLGAVVRSVTEIPLNLPPELRGQELSIEQVRQYAGPAQTYVVFRTSPENVDAVYMGDHCSGR